MIAVSGGIESFKEYLMVDCASAGMLLFCISIKDETASNIKISGAFIQQH